MHGAFTLQSEIAHVTLQDHMPKPERKTIAIFSCDDFFLGAFFFCAWPFYGAFFFYRKALYYGINFLLNMSINSFTFTVTILSVL